MPSLLNWSSALIAAGVVVPLLVLLYFLKLRRREMDVSSTLLWKKAIHDLEVNAPFQRLRRNLLFLLQLALLISLLAAFARPVSNYQGPPGKLCVILIDRSASMSVMDADGRTRLQDAKRQAQQLVDRMDKGSSAMVIAFDDSAQIIRSFETEHASLKTAIESISPTDRPTRLKRAFELAEARSGAFYKDELRSSAVRPEIWLYSDGRFADRAEVSLHDADLKFIRIGSAESQNIGIVALKASRNYERPTEVEVFVRLANFGDREAAPSLQLSIDGQIPVGGIKTDFRLLPQRWPAEKRKGSRENARFKFDLDRGAVVRVELKGIPDDALAADNVAHLVVPPPRPLNVLLVTSGNLWLERFLQSAELKNPQTITATDYEQRMKDPQALASKFDLVIFDRYRPKALPPAGNFIYFSSFPPDTKISAARDADGDVLLHDHLVMDWDRDHPILRGLNLRFYASETLKLQLPLEAKVLVEGRLGPLVAMYREPRRSHLLIAFDIQESTWPTTGSFPVFMDKAIQYLAVGADMQLPQSYPPGATPRIPRSSLQQAGEVKEVRIRGPMPTVSVPVPPTGDFALPPLEKVGLYELDPPVPQYEKIAVNVLDDNESNILPAEQEPVTGAKATAAPPRKARLELWWWIIALVAIPLCLIEWWVYTRRVHL